MHAKNEYVCPACQAEGGTSLQELEYELEGNILTITRLYECMYCYCSWQQTVKAECKLISNERIAW